jgi:DNA invertase Pin-like site-specific DNA recombinase
MKTAYSYIRFSTPEQEMGDSERRQLALAQSYCTKSGLCLSETAFADRGVSAFHGKHRENGALGRLLKHVQPGDVLLIEDCDRWSREDPLDALTRLREEVRRGIEVVFLRTGVCVTKDNFSDPAILYPNFFGAVLGNAENRKRAERIKASWDARKQTAAGGKAVCMNRLPCWLGWDETNARPVINSAKAAIIRRLFELACAGDGILAICRKMADTPPVSSSKKNPCWNPTSLRRLLSDKAVCGYYTQTEPPTPGVWPVLIDETTYWRAHAALGFSKRQTRPARSEAHLFTGLAKCGGCGEHNLIAHTSNRVGGRARLVCGGAGKGRSNCGFAGAPLDLIEKSFFSFLADAVLIRPLLTAKSSNPWKLDELQRELAEAERMAARIAELILGDDEAPKLLYDRLKLEEARGKQLGSAIDAETMRLKAEAPALETYKSFRETLANKSIDKMYRTEWRRVFAALLDKIVLDPHGKDGVWCFTVHFKGAYEVVEIVCKANPESLLHRDLRPRDQLRLREWSHCGLNNLSREKNIPTISDPNCLPQSRDIHERLLSCSEHHSASCVLADSGV